MINCSLSDKLCEKMKVIQQHEIEAPQSISQKGFNDDKTFATFNILRLEKISSEKYFSPLSIVKKSFLTQ